MPLAVVESRSFPQLSSAYRDLTDGLRALAVDLGTPPAPSPAPAAESPPRSRVREAVEITARGVGAVFLQAVLIGTALLVGFHVWMVLFPPLRPTN